jgi:glycosyltransferase involved in cell wall biosynthesis
MPAFNAAKTLRQTYSELPRGVIDEAILVDDGSSDTTVEMARELGLNTFRHPTNRGYGGNQKTCYREALRKGADVIIMIHPDYQYSPRLTVALTAMVAYGEYDAALASRILGVGALKGGMPLYKYIANRVLTAVQNILLNYKLSEYHTGYRAYSRQVLESLPLEENSDDFLFDNEILAQMIFLGYRIGEISCPTRYFEAASSITFRRSLKYGVGVLGTSFKFRLQKLRLAKFRIFDTREGKRLLPISNDALD